MLGYTRKQQKWTREDKERLRALASQKIGPKAAARLFPQYHPDSVRCQYYELTYNRKKSDRGNVIQLSTTVNRSMQIFLEEESTKNNVSVSSMIREALRYYRDGLTSGAIRATLVHHTEKSE